MIWYRFEQTSKIVFIIHLMYRFLQKILYLHLGNFTIIGDVIQSKKLCDTSNFISTCTRVYLQFLLLYDYLSIQNVLL